MKFFLKKFGAAICIAQVFRGVAARVDLHADGSALKGGIHIGDTLAMRMIEGFGDAKNGSQAASHALIGVIQRRIRDVMAGRIGFAIVVAHQGGNDSAVAPRETRNVAIEREVFAVFMVAAVADHVAGIVEQSAGFEQDTRFGGQMVNRLQLVKKQDAQLADMLGVTLIVLHAAREAARANEELARGSAVAVRLAG